MPILFLITFTYLLLAGIAEASPSKVSTLVNAPIIVNDPAWAPYFFAGAKDAAPGLVKESLSRCLTEAKIPFEFRNMAIERMQVAIEEGKLDINFFSYKPERAVYLDYSAEPLFVASYRPIVRADSQLKIESLNDFDQLRLGHTIGMRYSKEFFRYIEDRKRNHSLDESSSVESNLLKLVHKRIDVFVATEDAAYYLADQLQLKDKIRVIPFSIQSASYFLSLSKRSPRITNRSLFLATMDSCFKQQKKDGTYCALAKKYQLACGQLEKSEPSR